MEKLAIKYILLNSFICQVNFVKLSASLARKLTVRCCFHMVNCTINVCVYVWCHFHSPIYHRSFWNIKTLHQSSLYVGDCYCCFFPHFSLHCAHNLFSHDLKPLISPRHRRRIVLRNWESVRREVCPNWSHYQ